MAEKKIEDDDDDSLDREGEELSKSLTDEEKMKIIEITKKGILDCTSRHHVIRLIVENVPKVSKRTASIMVNRIVKETARSEARLKLDESMNRGLLIARLEAAYTLAVNRGDVRSAISAAIELAKSQGVYPMAAKQTTPRVVDKSVTNVLNVTGEAIENLDELSDAQLRAALDRRVVSVKQSRALIDSSNGDYEELDMHRDGEKEYEGDSIE